MAGAGRGVLLGFQTRSDLGSAAPRPPEVTFGAPPANYVAGRGYSGFGMAGNASGEVQLGGAGRGRGASLQAAAPASDYSESMWDKTMGYGGERLFARDAYEEDDAEADRIYESIDEHMDGRHKRRREEMQSGKRDGEPKKISERFSDLKRELATVTAEQWEAIPEVGDHSLKLKQKREKESFTPLTDSLIMASMSGAGIINGNSAGYVTSVDAMQFTEKLDSLGDSVTGQTVVDPKGYLTSLSSMRVNTDSEVGDIKKARLLLGSVTSTNPKHAPGWIAAALVEEVAGKMVAARKIILSGCEACPDAEDVWLEAVRLHPPDSAKTILAQAVKHLPKSVKLWVKAADLETTDAAKRIVLRRALEFVPNSVILWKTAIQLEGVSDAKIMLARAVECIPQSLDMWLALAKLETHENARKVLNQARAALPTEPAPWVTAARLEEAHGNFSSVPQIIRAMLASLGQYQVVIAREAWIREAQQAEHSGAVKTSEALVQATLHLGVDEEDRLATYLDDAEGCMAVSPPARETARAIYALALSLYPTRRTLWLACAMFEKTHGSAATLDATLRSAVERCPHEEVLWLMAAKEQWMAGDVTRARDLLKSAFDANPGSQQIWLAAAKLEWENGEVVRARALLARARETASSERVWMKAALLEEEQGRREDELKLLDEALVRYPGFAKFYMMAGQACEAAGDLARARDYYQRGIKVCPEAIPLWLLSSRLEEKDKGANRARPILELARLKMPGAEVLWLESVRLERRAGSDKAADAVMAKALQACPSSGLLWAEDVLTCPRPAQKTKSVDALKRCDNDPYVVTAVARVFDKDRKLPKARKWFERAVVLDPKLGDAWVYYYCFELCVQAIGDTGAGPGQGPGAEGKVGGEAGDSAEEVLKRCAAAEPNRGLLWCPVAKRVELRHSGAAKVLRVCASEFLGQ